MALLKKKTRKAIKKALKKTVNKHGPVIAAHLANALAAGIIAYLAAEPKKGKKRLGKIIDAVPNKKLRRALKAMPALVNVAGGGWSGNNGGKKRKEQESSHAHV